MSTLILGIETSCDETACAIIKGKHILSHQVASQQDHHQPYGGVVPEIASRAHLDMLPCLMEITLKKAEISLDKIDGIAVTAGPGLMGGLIVGVTFAKALALNLNKPIIAVNHLEAHGLTPRLTCDLDFPYLLLLSSGGHCQFIFMKDFRDYHLLGQTKDDAAGECFDKVARHLGLGYPGGPLIEKMANQGDAYRFRLPKPFCQEKHCDFSFSGLKTASMRLIDTMPKDEQTKKDFCASFQRTMAKIFKNRFHQAIVMAQSLYPSFRHCVIAGGVAANQVIFKPIDQVARTLGLDGVFIPPKDLCTDNAAMVAWAGFESLSRGYQSQLSFAVQSRWSLDSLSLSSF